MMKYSIRILDPEPVGLLGEELDVVLSQDSQEGLHVRPAVVQVLWPHLADGHVLWWQVLVRPHPFCPLLVSCLRKANPSPFLHRLSRGRGSRGNAWKLLI